MSRSSVPVYVDLQFSKVMSLSKRLQLLDVLEDIAPSHYQRLWFVGFLKFVGYTASEICDIIHYGATWANYSQVMTYNQVSSVFKSSGHLGSVGKGISSPSGTWIRHEDWVKQYGNRPLCTLHYVRCKDCPDHDRDCSALSGGRE